MIGAMDRYLEEILGQPGALERAASGLREQVATLERLGGLPRRDPIVLTGMGSSYDACLAGAATLGSAGVLVTTLDSAEAVHSRLRAVEHAGLVVMVSQSGRSVEALRLAEALRGSRDAFRLAPDAPRPVLLAITNGADTPLTGLADLVLDTRAGREVCPSTMTFAAALVVLAAVADVLGGGDPGEAVSGAARAAAVAAAAASVVLAGPEQTGVDLERWLGGRSTIFALGRGVGLAAAEMTALSLMEAAGVPAASMSTAEFRHGPLEIAGPDLAVILFALEPATLDRDRELAGELAAAGVAVLLVRPAGIGAAVGGGAAAGGLAGIVHVPIPVTSPILAPAVAIGPLQLLARQLAHSRGRRPDTFARASKVTIRE